MYVFLRYSAIGISYPEIAKATTQYHRKVQLGPLTFRFEKRAPRFQLYIRIFNCFLVYSISQTATVSRYFKRERNRLSI